MPKVYGRDLDLNLLRVFAVVAESGSVTEAANRLYMTQPAVSAALRRLAAATGRRCSCAADAGSPSPAVATIPEVVATQIRATRLHLKTRPLPFAIKGGHAELLWPSATDDDSSTAGAASARDHSATGATGTCNHSACRTKPATEYQRE